MEVKWLRSLRNYLSKIDGTIEVDSPGILPLQRLHDVYLMDIIIQSNQFSPLQIRRLDLCRKFLQALTLSDITDATGTALDPAMLHGSSSLLSSVSLLHHFKQDRPPSASWTLWRRACKLWSCNAILIQPLGA